jgi:exodeoxyribonuclease VII large subunit
VMRAQMTLDSLARGVIKRDGERLLREPVMRLDSARAQLSQAMRAAIEQRVRRLAEARQGHRANQPARVLERRQEALVHLRQRLERVGGHALSKRGEQVEHLRGLLRALGPDTAFQRGFSITLGSDGKIAKSTADFKPGDVLRTRFADGETVSVVQAG